MKPATRTFYQEAVRRSCAQIVDSLDAALDLTALAKQAALAPLHFHHVFRGMVGETPLELHRRLRLERAGARLLDTDDAVTAIAFDAGYETHEATTRVFRKTYASSPTEWRAKAHAARASCERPPQHLIAARCGLHFPDGELTFLPGERTMDATIETIPRMRVAAVRHIGPYNQISEAYARLGRIAGPAGLYATPGIKMVGLYYDSPEATPTAELRSDAGLALPDGTPIPAGLSEVIIPAGRYAKSVHKGPYSGLPDAWAQLMGGWIPQHGHRVDGGVSFEVYPNSPMDTKPEDLLTEIYVPLAE